MNKDVLAQKEADVAELSKKISDSSSVVVVEYRGTYRSGDHRTPTCSPQRKR